MAKTEWKERKVFSIDEVAVNQCLEAWITSKVEEILSSLR